MKQNLEQNLHFSSEFSVFVVRKIWIIWIWNRHGIINCFCHHIYRIFKHLFIIIRLKQTNFTCIFISFLQRKKKVRIMRVKLMRVMCWKYKSRYFIILITKLFIPHDVYIYLNKYFDTMMKITYYSFNFL